MLAALHCTNGCSFVKLQDFQDLTMMGEGEPVHKLTKSAVKRISKAQPQQPMASGWSQPTDVKKISDEYMQKTQMLMSMGTSPGWAQCASQTGQIKDMHSLACACSPDVHQVALLGNWMLPAQLLD